MTTLPCVLAPVRATVASMLRFPDHTGNLYPANDVMIALNIAADATDGALVDATLFLCAFVNEFEDEFVLNYCEYFHCHGDGRVHYVRHEARSGRHEGTNQKLFFWMIRIDRIGMTRHRHPVSHWYG